MRVTTLVPGSLGHGRAGLLAAIVVVAFLVRTVFLARAVLTPAGVNFQDVDAWYHMRLVDNLVHNYPHRITVDPYLGPDAPAVGVAMLFDLAVGGLAWLVGLGAPSPRTVEVVAALVPPALGALTAVPVFFLGQRLSGPLVGFLAAGLLAVAPGQLLARSLVGFTDHHVAEAFLTAVSVLACVRALEADSPRRRLGAALLAGAALAAYLLAWSGGALLVLVLAAWGAAQYAVDDARGEAADRVAPVLVPALALALAGLLLVQDRGLWSFAIQVTALVGALAFVVTIAAGRRGLRALAAPRGALLVCVVVVAAAGAVVLAVVARDLVDRILAELQRFRPGRTGFTVSEVRPLLWMSGTLSLETPLQVFGPAFYVGLGALAALAWRAARTGRPSLVLVVVWSALMYAATLGQNRFGYYLGLSLALLTGWACGRTLAWGWSPSRRAGPRADAGRARAVPGERDRGSLVRRALAVIAVVVVVLVPSAMLARPLAGNDLGLGRGYRVSLEWLRRNTPDPFGDPDYYVARYSAGHTRRPAYTVMAWWDYGYEIIRLGRRVPVANPGHAGADVAGRFFTATDEAAATRILDATGARYVMTHVEVPILPREGLVQGKFETLVAWAGKDLDRYWETFLTRDAQGRPGRLTLFHPEYYRTLAVRLHVFGGAAVTPDDSTFVVTYVERDMPDGTRAKELVALQRFRTYAAAAAHLDRTGHAGRALVGFDSRQTPVPIEALTRFRFLHESPGHPPAVRIFEYTGRP